MRRGRVFSASWAAAITFRSICQTEGKLVRAKIDDRAWFTVVRDRSTCVSGSEELRLVELGCKRACAHPMGETGRSGQRIIGLAGDKIAQTKLGWIDFHRRARARRSLLVDLASGRIRPAGGPAIPATECCSLASQ
jgi:hypothetical protein